MKRKHKTKKIVRQRGGDPPHSLTIPREFLPEVEHLLWFNTLPKNINLNIKNNINKNKTKSVSDALTFIMLQLGATKELLETNCVAICGPTAVGKTKFINMIKKKYGAEVIDMDTMQVYSGISVGTGRTNLANTEGSHLYGIYNPNNPFHIVKYLHDVFIAVQKIKSKNHPIVFEGASKSLLDVLMLIFPNMVVFGIEAVNTDNIIERVTLRIDDTFVKNAILELAELLRTEQITLNSPVIQNNPEVYFLIKQEFTKGELLNSNLSQKIDKEFSEKLVYLRKKIIEQNIQLHLAQYKRLKTIPSIRWFTNDEASVAKLDQAFYELWESWKAPSKVSILQASTNFNTIPSSLCEKNITNPDKAACEKIEALFHSEKPEVAIEFAAKLNVPLLPKKHSGQIVLGITKYLLPYAVLDEYFTMFAIPPGEWTLDKNILLIECIALNNIKASIIRLVTTPAELVNDTSNYKITAHEICVLKNYGFSFYKYISPEYNNIYFCSKVKLNQCELVDVSNGAFRCKTEELGDLYF